MSAKGLPGTRVLPRGKVYRQLFDAQTQLTETLARPRLNTASIDDTNSAPIVHLTKEETAYGILSQRQKTWMEEIPFNLHTENPVMYKHYSDFVSSMLQDSKSTISSQDVSALPECVASAKCGSDINERISANRRARHEAVVEDMCQELSIISHELEPEIIAAAEKLSNLLEEDDKKMEILLAKLNDDKELKEKTLTSLYQLWTDIKTHSSIRQKWISEIDSSLASLEETRMSKIQGVFLYYAEIFSKISYLLTPDLHKYLDSQAQIVNQAVLSNRRAYADVYVQLMSADIERERNQHNYWKSKLEFWRREKVKAIIKEFKEFMENEETKNPSEVEDILKFMLAEQSCLGEKSKELINSLRELVPPKSTKESAFQWYNQINNLICTIDCLNNEYLKKVYTAYESACSSYLGKIEKLKKRLLDENVRAPEKVQTIVEEHMLPLVGERQHVFEAILENMEENLNKHLKYIDGLMKSLFRFVQGAAHVWDIHQIELAKKESELQETLDNERLNHNYENQEEEAKLDVLMDTMRQEATEAGLKSCMNNISAVLENIETRYKAFNEEQIKIVLTYPLLVEQELEEYAKNICSFFAVQMIPEMGEAISQVKQDSPASLTRHLKDSDEHIIHVQKHSSPMVVNNVKVSKPTIDGDNNTALPENINQSSLPTTKSSQDQPNCANEENISQVDLNGEKSSTPAKADQLGATLADEIPGSIFHTNNGARFLIKMPSDASKESIIREIDGELDYIKNIDISVTTIQEIKKQICFNFLNHLEYWRKKALSQADDLVKAKTMELNSELELQIHLHQPRQQRAEQDVYNVRAAELLLHSERVENHCNGVQVALDNLKTKFSTLTDEQEMMVNTFQKKIDNMEPEFLNITKSTRLVIVRNKISMKIDQLMIDIRTTLREFRAHLEEALQTLRESNAKLMKHFKLFSDGGNFCTQEVDMYRSQIESMAHSIDTRESQVLVEMEGMESKRLDQAIKIAADFEERFKNHVFDLLFMEKIAHWLTNTQVKVKVEVAKSNSQSGKLTDCLSSFEEKIDAYEQPNPDKVQVTVSDLLSDLKPMFELFYKRSTYLNCLLRDQDLLSLFEDGIDDEVIISTSIPPVSKPGKQMLDDPSLRVMKKILIDQKNIEMDTTFLGNIVTSGSSEISAISGKQKIRSSVSNSSRASKSKPKLSKNAETSKKKPDFIRTLSVSSQVSLKSSTKNERRQKVDREALTFLSLIKEILDFTSTNLSAIAEVYYKQKGNRPITRPQLLQETLDRCVDTLTEKLTSYYQQSEQYHKQCIIEYREQLSKLEDLMEHIPFLLITEILEKHLHVVDMEYKKLDSEFSDVMDTVRARKEKHNFLLHPSLGHPQKLNELEELDKMEAVRHEDCLRIVDEHTQKLQLCIENCAKNFVENLVQMSEKQLLLYDDMIIEDEVMEMKTERKRHLTSELLRRKNAGRPFVDKKKKNMSRGRGLWNGLPLGELCLKTERKSESASISTAKTTLPHKSTVNARNEAYKTYKEHFLTLLTSTEKKKKKLMNEEDEWFAKWNISVKEVKNLY